MVSCAGMSPPGRELVGVGVLVDETEGDEEVGVLVIPNCGMGKKIWCVDAVVGVGVWGMALCAPPSDVQYQHDPLPEHPLVQEPELIHEFSSINWQTGAFGSTGFGP